MHHIEVARSLNTSTLSSQFRDHQQVSTQPTWLTDVIFRHILVTAKTICLLYLICLISTYSISLKKYKNCKHSPGLKCFLRKYLSCFWSCCKGWNRPLDGVITSVQWLRVMLAGLAWCRTGNSWKKRKKKQTNPKKPIQCSTGANMLTGLWVNFTYLWSWLTEDLGTFAFLPAVILIYFLSLEELRWSLCRSHTELLLFSVTADTVSFWVFFFFVVIKLKKQ